MTMLTPDFSSRPKMPTSNEVFDPIRTSDPFNAMRLESFTSVRDRPISCQPLKLSFALARANSCSFAGVADILDFGFTGRPRVITATRYQTPIRSRELNAVRNGDWVARNIENFFPPRLRQRSVNYFRVNRTEVLPRAVFDHEGIRRGLIRANLF
jgi:hypothetical protein